MSNAGAVNARSAILKKESCHIHDWNECRKVPKVGTLVIFGFSRLVLGRFSTCTICGLIHPRKVFVKQLRS